jgi:hypothetical protein
MDNETIITAVKVNIAERFLLRTLTAMSRSLLEESRHNTEISRHNTEISRHNTEISRQFRIDVKERMAKLGIILP